MPLLLILKSYIPEHQRRLKNGNVITVAAYYDKRIKKAARHAPDHTHEVSHLSDADKVTFANMHKEQHVSHYYEAHALKRKLDAEHVLRNTLKRSLDRYKAAGDTKSWTLTQRKLEALESRMIIHQKHLTRAETIVAGLGRLKDKLVKDSGTLNDDADTAHAQYVEKLGERFKENPYQTGRLLPASAAPSYFKAVILNSKEGDIIPNPKFNLGKLSKKATQELSLIIDGAGDKQRKVRVSGRTIKHIAEQRPKLAEHIVNNLVEFFTDNPEVYPNHQYQDRALLVHQGDAVSGDKHYAAAVEVIIKGDWIDIISMMSMPERTLKKARQLKQEIMDGQQPQNSDSHHHVASKDAHAEADFTGVHDSLGSSIAPTAKNTSSTDDLNPNSPNYRYRDTGTIAGSKKEQAAMRIKNAAKSGERLNATDIDWDDIEQNPREAQTLITKANLFGAVDWNALKENGMQAGAGFLIDKVYKAIAKSPEDDSKERKNYAIALQTLRDRLEVCKTPDEVMKTLADIRDEFMGKMKSNAGETVANPLFDVWAALGKNFVGIIKPGYRYAGTEYNKFNPAFYKSGNKTFLDHAIKANNGGIPDWSWAEKSTRPSTGETTPREKPFQLLVADKITRTGGNAITVDSTQALKDRIGLRDVQSGTWVLKDKDSAMFHVQKCAEAFSDLSDILGVSLDKIALNGRLAMAFGARGSGHHLAHYEPVQRVINLTKMKGGGSLAHEWLHSLDNTIAEIETGNKTSVGDFLSENPDLLPEGKLKSAMLNLRRAMSEGDIPIKAPVSYTAKDISLAKYNFDGTGNRFFARIRDAGSLDNAIDIINNAPGRIEKNLRKVTAAYYDNNPKGGTVDIPTGETQSMFAAGALRLDKGKHAKYWSQPKEMLARAFEAYAHDKLKAEGRENTYLTAHARNDDYDAMGAYKPYPEGAERRRINAAFDAFFEALRESGTLHKALSVSPTPLVLFFRKIISSQ